MTTIEQLEAEEKRIWKEWHDLKKVADAKFSEWGKISYEIHKAKLRVAAEMEKIKYERARD